LRANININLKEVLIMSESQMKDRIVEELKKAKEARQGITDLLNRAADIVKK